MLPVYENLFPNPRLVGDGTYAEVRRNLALNPIGVSALSFFPNNGLNHTVERNVAITGHPQGITTAVKSYRKAGATSVSTTQTASFYDIDGLGATGPARIPGVWVWSSRAGMEATIGPPSVQAHYQALPSQSWVFINNHPGYDALAYSGLTVKTIDGSDVSTDDYALTTGATMLANEIPQETIAPGATLHLTDQPEDFRTRWLGNPNASESVMEIERVRGLTGVNAIAGVSTWAGKSAVRVIPAGSGGENNSFVSYFTPAGPGRSGGTALGTLHISDTLSLPRNANSHSLYTQITTSPGSFDRSTAPSMNPGSYPLRMPFAEYTGDFRQRLYNGGAQGSGDVWWTDIGLFAGDYDGPAFSGDSGVVVIDGQLYDTLWAGAPDSSSSLAILSEVYSSPIYDTLYVLSTVSNSWSRWQTPAAKGQRPVTLARVTSSL